MPGPFCYSTADDPLGGRGPLILKRVHGAVISEASASPDDRVVRLALESAERLAIYLYGNAVKVRVESGSHIIESLAPAETGAPLPSITRTGPAPLVMSASLGDAPLTPAEACRAAAGLEPELAACFTRDDGMLDGAALLAFRDTFLSGKTPFGLASNRRIGRVTPVPADARDAFLHRLGPYRTAVDGCGAAGAAMAKEAYDIILSRLRTPIRRQLDSRSALMEGLEGGLRKAETHAAGRAEADILAAFQTRVPAGATEIELPDLYAPGNTRRITLDPMVPVTEQVRRRYKEVAKLERSRESLRKRIAAVRAEITALAEALEQSERAASFDEAFGTLEKAVPARKNRRAAPSTREAPRYRSFDLDPRWFVLIGRNDRENDEITFRIASPEDVWMHAQHVPGSHVVLRSRGGGENPPKSILERSAAIAAFYSKARHSKIVPVIYTLRKYVRKFKGGRPGQVFCEREKTLFVEPSEPGRPGGPGEARS
jgi:predicted ribosome quality control (RQC) complex YloA/Tae2 family protein